VIDAASGAIYVIGGHGGVITRYQDVWASTDGGLRPDSRRGWSGGTRRVLRGTREVRHSYYRGTMGFYVVE
jgi:hypothetical protein